MNSCSPQCIHCLCLYLGFEGHSQPVCVLLPWNRLLCSGQQSDVVCENVAPFCSREIQAGAQGSCRQRWALLASSGSRAEVHAWKPHQTTLPTVPFLDEFCCCCCCAADDCSIGGNLTIGNLETFCMWLCVYFCVVVCLWLCAYLSVVMCV